MKNLPLTFEKIHKSKTNSPLQNSKNKNKHTLEMLPRASVVMTTRENHVGNRERLMRSHTEEVDTGRACFSRKVLCLHAPLAAAAGAEAKRLALAIPPKI